MTPLLRPKQVFLTYAHGDKKTVRALYQRLIRHNIDAWFDEKELLPGQPWKHEILQAILRSEAVIICLSQQFIKQGGYRHQELKIALAKARSIPEAEIFLIPVRLEDCEVPEPLRHWQYVNLFEKDGYKKLFETLKEKRLAGLTKKKKQLY
jgi:hypothetical protein